MYIQKRPVAWLACYYCRYIVYFRTLCFYLRPCVGHMLACHKLAQYSIAVVISACKSLYVFSSHAQAKTEFCKNSVYLPICIWVRIRNYKRSQAVHDKPHVPKVAIRRIGIHLICAHQRFSQRSFRLLHRRYRARFFLVYL